MSGTDGGCKEHKDQDGQAIGTRILLTRAPFIKQNRAPGFPIGISLIASFLESKGVPVGVLDLAVQPDWQKAITEELGKHSYGVIGISFQITQYEEAAQLARYLKQRQPAVKIVFGGSYASSAPNHCIMNRDVDAVCCGEGERTFYDLLKAWENGQPLKSVDGIVFRGEDGQPLRTSPRTLIEDLNEMPLPAYHLLNLEPYISAEHTSDFTGKKQRCMELITSRGCPYHCIYCHSFFGKQFRGRSPQNVMDEILLLHKTYRVSEFVIWDDTFTMDLKRAKDICDLIIGSGIKIALQLRGGVRVERMDEELMSKLKKAGVETMCVGIESAVWRVQQMIKKNVKIEKVDGLLDLARKYRITTIGLMMLGFPGESVGEMKESIRWARKSKLDYTFFSIVTPYPGTELHEIATSKGYFAGTDDLGNMNVMIPHMEIPGMKPGSLKRLQIRAYLGFYLMPWRLRNLLSSRYLVKVFAASLFNYMAVAFSYFGKRLFSPQRQHLPSTILSK